MTFNNVNDTQSQGVWVGEKWEQMKRREKEK